MNRMPRSRLYGSISVHELADATVCQVRGEIDAALRGEAGAALARMSELSRPVVMDVSEVTFIDSCGLAFLIMCSRVIADGGSRMKLSGASAAVLELLDVSGATHLFDITEAAEGR